MNFYFKDLIEKTLLEDAAMRDSTSLVLGSLGEKRMSASVISKSSGIFCGEKWLDGLCEVFPTLRLYKKKEDRNPIVKGEVVISFEDTCRNILGYERSLLNGLTVLSGIATKTHRIVQKLGLDSKIKILATRKTLPLLRAFELYGVSIGGGFVHRWDLANGIMVKDNHLVCLSLEEWLTLIREKKSPLQGVEIEIDSIELLQRLFAFVAETSYFSMPNIVMLDNFSNEELLRIQAFIHAWKMDHPNMPPFQIEISGGITEERVEWLSTLPMVDYMSLGALTLTLCPLDFSLDLSGS